jgi:hypothetical protein
MHLAVSRTRAGVLASVIRFDFAPCQTTSRIPRSRATDCSSQSPLRSQVWQSPSWSLRIRSTTVRRASRTLGVLVCTFIPSAAGVTQEATSVLAPSTSTMQTRHEPMACTSLR